jgi:hypothetical protein
MRTSVGWDWRGSSTYAKEAQMQKDKSPLDPETRRQIELARNLQKEIDKITGREDPKFVKGTIEPTTKK